MLSRNSGRENVGFEPVGIMSCAIVAFIAMSVLIAYTTSVQSVPIKEENTIVIDDDDIPSIETSQDFIKNFDDKGVP